MLTPPPPPLPTSFITPKPSVRSGTAIHASFDSILRRFRPRFAELEKDLHDWSLVPKSPPRRLLPRLPRTRRWEDGGTGGGGGGERGEVVGGDTSRPFTGLEQRLFFFFFSFSDRECTQLLKFILFTGRFEHLRVVEVFMKPPGLLSQKSGFYLADVEGNIGC